MKGAPKWAGQLLLATNFDLLWTRESQQASGEPPLQGLGTEPPRSKDVDVETSSGTHTFDFYNAMLVFASRAIIGTSGEGAGYTSSVYLRKGWIRVAAL